MAVRRNYRINLRNYGNPPAIMVSQYDENYDLVFEVYDGVVPATGLNAYTVKLVGRQPGNDPALKYEFTGTVSGIANNILSFTIDTTMTGRAGKGTAEIVILDTTNDVKFASFNLPVYVEKAAVPDDAIDADVERAQEIAEQVEELIDGATEGAEAWAVGQRGGVDVESTDPTYHNNAKYYSEVAQDIADSIGIDATLSISGKAADAKKTGDEISSLKEDLNSVSVPYNLYNPKNSYTQTNKGGDSRTGYTINSDGSISCIRTNGQYGEVYLVDSNRTLKAGTYTISGKITLTTDNTDSRSLKICIGRTATSKTVIQTTERGGDTPISVGTKIGWFMTVFTLTEDEQFAFMVIPSYSSQADGSHPCLIENLLITSGDELLEYLPDLHSANDKFAHQEVNKTNNRIGEISERYNLYNKSVAYAQTNAGGTAKTGYTVNSNGTITCTRSLGNYGQLYLVDPTRTISAGKYTISGKITLTEDSPTGRQVSVGVGRSGGASTVNLMTERGGNTRIASGDKVGWFNMTLTVSEDEPFAFMVIPSESNMVSTNHPCTIEYLMLTDTDFLTDYTDQSDTAIDIIARERIKNAGFLVPDRIFNGEPYTGEYDWQTPVVSYGALFNGKSQVESFAFFSDPHVMGFGDSSRNTVKMENYFKRVQKTVNATPCLFSVCGGDLLNNGTTMDEACYRLGLLKGIMTHLLDGCKLVIGNHDTNYQGKEDSESADWTGRLSNGTIDSILYRDTDTKKAYYSFDGANSKCYVLDSGVEHSTMAPRDWEQVDWLANKLIEDDAEHSIIFLHIILNSGSVQLNASNFASVVEAYNGRETVTLNGETYDFASCTGKVEFWVAGHTHVDSTGTLGGIPYIITATNSYNSDVPLIDLVLADYEGGTVELIRVGGTGENRSISLS